MPAKLKLFLFSPFFRLLTAAVLIGLLVSCLNINIKELQQICLSCRLGSLAIGWLILGGVVFTGALSWKVLIQGLGLHLSLLLSCKITLISYAFNNLIPGGIVGELYRISSAKQQKIPLVSAVLTVILEIWASACALALTIALSFVCVGPSVLSSNPVFLKLLEYLPTKLILLTRSNLFICALIFFAVVAVLITAAVVIAQRLLFQALSVFNYDNKKRTKDHKIYTYVYQHIRNKIYYFIEKLGIETENIYHNIDYINKHKTSLTKSIYCAVIINIFTSICEAVAYIFLAESLGLKISFSVFFSTVPLFSLLSCLPISINGLGTQETAAIILWPCFSLNNEEILALSALNHIGKLVWSLLGLCLYSFAVAEKESL
ncbi:MAG: lysylphosphatidylglycerol synthase transmembrane domain-containing protein [Candidatus Bruticola sp.]